MDNFFSPAPLFKTEGITNSTVVNYYLHYHF
jgi:hypothetical protein